MYRFLLTPRWLAFHVLVVFGMVLMANLGFWQLRRLDERQAFNAAVASRIDLPPAPLDEVLTPDVDPDAVEWRSVTATGTYLPAEELVVVNRSQGGVAGEVVVTPLELAGGRLLLVARGFVPLAEQAAPPPTGTVAVTGRLRPSQQRQTGQLSDPSSGELAEAQRVDIPRLAPQLPGEPVPMYVELTESEPAGSGVFPQALTPPELADGPHLSYALQWFIFSVAVVVGWVLAVRKSVTSRRAAARRAAAAASPAAADAPATTSPG